MGGGGGDKTSTTTSGIAPEFVPHMEKALGIATNRLSGQFDEAGNLRDPSAEGIVAGLSGDQEAGLGAQRDLATQAIQGTGIYNDRANVQRMMQNAQGAQQVGQQGALGSARGERANAAALADMGMQFQQNRQMSAEGGAQSLQDVGATYQDQQQRVLDAPYTELQRYSNILTGMAPQQSTTHQSGGGK